jgi:ribonuclease HIII
MRHCFPDIEIHPGGIICSKPLRLSYILTQQLSAHIIYTSLNYPEMKYNKIIKEKMNGDAICVWISAG